MILHGALSPVPVLEQAFADLEHSGLDGLDRTLYFHDTFGRLREHLLAGDHASTGSVLDLLDLEPRAADDRAHEVVADEKADRGEGADGRRGQRRVGERGLEKETGDLAVSAGDALKFAGSAEDPVLNPSDDLRYTSLDAGQLADVGNGSAAFADYDTGFFRANEGAEGELMGTGSGGVDRGSILGTFGGGRV